MTDSSASDPPDDAERAEITSRYDETSRRSRAEGRRDETERIDAENDTGYVRRFLTSDDDTIVLVRDVVSVVAIVAVIGLVLFAVSGVWPPFVAIESASMEPNIDTGDLAFVVAEDRYVGDGPVADTGIVTAESGHQSGYETFGATGDVIVFAPNGDPTETPIIHRAHFWVEDGENWVDERAEPAHLYGQTCDEVATCPAPHDGFVTMGDANDGYDQLETAGAETTVVHPDWVTGKAMVRLPWLGHVRLLFDSIRGLVVASVFAVASTR